MNAILWIVSIIGFLAWLIWTWFYLVIPLWKLCSRCDKYHKGCEIYAAYISHWMKLQRVYK